MPLSEWIHKDQDRSEDAEIDGEITVPETHRSNSAPAVKSQPTHVSRHYPSDKWKEPPPGPTPLRQVQSSESLPNSDDEASLSATLPSSASLWTVSAAASDSPNPGPGPKFPRVIWEEEWDGHVENRNKPGTAAYYKRSRHFRKARKQGREQMPGQKRRELDEKEDVSDEEELPTVESGSDEDDGPCECSRDEVKEDWGKRNLRKR
ncbi:hypothetical protein ACEQ8H_005619 [Pleosporales sp. CAS-2024a]